MDKIYRMKLHDIIEAGDKNISYQIFRVSGGWVYRFFQLHQETGGDGQWSENYIADSVFVPFDNEYINKN